MEALRQTNQHGKMGTSSGGGPTVIHTQQGQGLAALLVMIAVLCFILAYCCWGAPCCRSFCRRRCCCHVNRANSQGDIEASPSDIGLSVDQGMVATPTIILLPYGRMLVVDGSVFAQLQADTSGLDLIELGENVVQAQQRPTLNVTLNSLTGSTPSILDVDSETNSKDGCISPTLGGLLPPTYESIFGSESMADLPPSYDEILQQVQVQETPETVNEEYQPGEIRESRV
ncbi:hypothetical protein B7P43_G15882 [Cryptotermes secundus]|uniref:Uncharacterized protein n=3 Tax=Cryptotermes secundus TaxID=105785 RepID=A0A2J7R6P3_9NEOP|nr:uncharacterized protein LOC111863081 isoform X2 [Cryptotermes secundus]XP_023704850.1 uncharacterized protein LOC111863081 isoform X2 [Cryptotermes secundus]XP_023704852.1 uncharacterized protein LOC111863081 isoform X2 [Cryptotermes secundus]XP_033606802.1 uncharacterized protein LOC111863081 isoform X2 [Cryptotermes secundus]XP_033606803.1 uncharacterized protein LOC111863081 isoform X2 [Cryptotermes secundus]PNF36501.1 hypothetical protein B7P43_G15882 [Cryptotermes secundus]PNF36502.1 